MAILFNRLVTNTYTFHNFFTSMKSDVFQLCCVIFSVGVKFSKNSCRTLYRGDLRNNSILEVGNVNWSAFLKFVSACRSILVRQTSTKKGGQYLYTTECINKSLEQLRSLGYGSICKVVFSIFFVTHYSSGFFFEREISFLHLNLRHSW